MKIALLVDSVACLPDEIINRPDVFVGHLSVQFVDGSTMLDTNQPKEIAEFLDRIDHDSELPTTSQPSFGELYELFDAMVDQGFDHVFGVALSSELSGTYDAFVSVANDFQDKIGATIYNTLSAVAVEEQFVADILAGIDAQQTVAEIEAQMDYRLAHHQIFIVVDQLTNLRKGGRLTASSALLGTLLRVKPLLTVNEQGQLVVSEKIRTNRRVDARLTELGIEAAKENGGKVVLRFLYTDETSLEHIQGIMADIQEEYPTLEMHKNIVSPVILTHIGRGAYGMAILPQAK